MNMIKHVRRHSSRCCSCYLLMVAILLEGVLSSSIKINDNGEITVTHLPIVSKRQINFQSSNFNEQQIPQEYANFYQQANAANNQKTQFEQQTAPQEFLPGSQYDAFPPTTTTTTLSSFGAEQVRLQTEYRERVLVEQLTNEQQKSRYRTPVQPSLQFQAQSQQRRPLNYLDENGRVRQQQEPVGSDSQQDVGPTQSDEPYSYAQVQFGAVLEPTEPSLVARPKGQRSVSRPRTNNPVLEPSVQQSIQNPATIFPIQFNPRLLQNVVYVQPNGQIHRPVEDAEPVVEIPRRNHRYYGHPSGSASGPETAASGVAPKPVTTAPAVPVEEEPLVLIPRPKKPENFAAGRFRQEGRKPGRTQQPVKTTRPPPPPPPPPQQHDQQQAEVEPDNFLMSLLYRLQQQHSDGEHGTTVASKPRGGQRSKGGDRSDASKYLPDRSQLQLLQFPHELQALSSAELRALEGASAQIAAADEKFVGQKRLPKNRPVAVSSSATPAVVQPERVRADAPFDAERNVRLSSGHRPVPTPVELNDEQRQFLAAQGIRNLYRVDYDQAGNALPLTYVLALDNRAKRDEQIPSTTATSPTDES